MKTLLITLAASACLTTAASAQHADHGPQTAPPAAAAPALAEGVGVIKSVNAKAGTITIAHEPIKSLKWPAMTMPFKAADKAVLAKAKAGAKVRFRLTSQTVVDIRPF